MHLKSSRYGTLLQEKKQGLARKGSDDREPEISFSEKQTLRGSVATPSQLLLMSTAYHFQGSFSAYWLCHSKHL